MHRILHSSVMETDDNNEDTRSWQTVATKRKQVESPHLTRKKQPLNEASTSNNNMRTVQSNASTSNNANKYAELSTDEDDAPTYPEVIPKPPPIFIPNVTNINYMIQKLKVVIPSNEFSYKSVRNDEIRLMTKSIDSYRKVVKCFDHEKIVYHSYQLKQERSYRVVIKGLHSSTPIDDIKAELITLGHPVRAITNVRSRITKEPLSMFFVDLNPNPNNKTIFDVKTINYAIVKVEPPARSTDIIQCYRCQEFGHTKSYCRKPFRCVKCGMDHSTVDCKKTANSPPKCVHCLMNHTANYKGCKIYQNLVATKRIRQRSNQPENVKFNVNSTDFPELNGHQNTPPFHSNPEATYAAMTKMQASDNARLERLERMMENLMNMMSMILAKQCN